MDAYSACRMASTGQAASEDCFSDERQRHAFVQRRDTCPFSGTLLPGGVENFLDDGLTIRVLVRENIAGDLN